MARQRDGLWKSETYPLLGSGQAMTPFVLYALSHLRGDEIHPHRTRIDRALGALPVEGAEYPSYSLALSIIALSRLDPGRDVTELKRRLRALQLTGDLGWSPDDPEYGGWDHGAIVPRKPQCQRPDVSVTALACEALGGDEKARGFAERCRAAEGGFLFTPNAASAHQNKAGPGKSYATATCDALRILGDDARGREWLERNLSHAAPKGLEGDAKWDEALFFYYAYALSKVRPSKELADAVAARQRPDGSFVNSRGLMKEDDPLIATGLALIALALAR
jgi:hypothetical protein